MATDTRPRKSGRCKERTFTCEERKDEKRIIQSIRRGSAIHSGMGRQLVLALRWCDIMFEIAISLKEYAFFFSF